METSTAESDDEQPPEQIAQNHDVNRVLSRLCPVLVGIALLLVISGTMTNCTTMVVNGVAVLIATPILTVLVATLTFGQQHDYRFMLVGLFVLVVIILGAVSGLH